MNALRRLWAYLGTIAAPAAVATPVVPAPLVPLGSERYLDVNREQTEWEDKRHTFLAARICEINNANVTRDYGFGPVVITDYEVEQLDAQEQADVDRLIKPAYARVNKQARNGGGS